MFSVCFTVIKTVTYIEYRKPLVQNIFSETLAKVYKKLTN